MKAIAPTLRRNVFYQALVLVTLAPGLILSPMPVAANPHGPNVVAGQASFNGFGTNRLDIHNLSKGNGRAIINWQSFSIQQGESTHIHQGANGFTLNRVVSGNPTAIYGLLKADKGGVMVVNPNGIVVHPGGSVDVAGMLTLSTLDIQNKDFLNGGSNRFRGTTAAGVRNYGAVSSSDGDVVLLGNFLQNAGSVSAPRGVVAFGAGGDIVVDQAGGAKISVLAGGSGKEVGIDNSGTVDAAAAELKAHGNVYALAIKNDGLVRASGYNFSGGRLTLSAGPQGRIVNTGQLSARNSDGSGGQVNISGGRVELTSGTVEANGEVGRAGGSVNVSGSSIQIGSAAAVQANGSVGGRISVAAANDTVVEGSVEAVGSQAAGGAVTVEGGSILVAGSAQVDVSGETGGGIAQIGGGFQGRDSTIRNADSLRIDDGARIAADAVGSGTGGSVILWSDGATEFAGTVSARGIEKGGFAEISGKSTLDIIDGDVDLTAASGKGGMLLLDPTDITISSIGANGLGGSTISNVWISQQLDAGTDVVIATNFGSGGAGDINIGRLTSTLEAKSDSIEWYQDAAGIVGGTLTLLAMGDIRFNVPVHSAGEGGINVVAGWDGFTGWTGPGSGAVGGGISFDMDAVLATMNDGNAANDAAGLNGGSVYIGDIGARMGVDVGSRWGDTKVAARDLILRGSIVVGNGRGWAQLGFTDNGVEYELSRVHNGIVINEWWGSTTNAQGKDYIALLGGTEFGTGDTLGLGDNAFRGAGWGATGNITAQLSGRVDARGGTTASYTQIGHGGILADGSEWKRAQNFKGDSAVDYDMVTRDGIVMDPYDDRRSFFASTWRTNYAGDAARIDADIKVIVDGDILLMGARGFDAADNQNTTRTDSIYSMIGHGGEENQGSYHGDITVVAHGKTPAGFLRGPEGLGIQLIGGRHTRSFAMIGHGSGYEGNRMSVWDQTRSGDIVVTATTGAIRLLGHNQEIRDGDLNFGAIIEPGVPTPYGNASDDSPLGSFVQIGHGGQNSSFLERVNSQTVKTNGIGGGFMMPGGANVQDIIPNGSMSGDITVFAGGVFTDPTDPTSQIGIQLRSGNRRWYFSQIGHGGTNHRADSGTAYTPAFGGGAHLPFGTPVVALPTGFTGDIHVEADRGSIIAKGGDSFRADRNWGYGYNHVHIGHGGDVVRGPKSGTITVLAGQGANAVAGDILVQAGRMLRSHGQIGHGGTDADGDIIVHYDGGGNPIDNTSEIIVTARGSISFISPESGEKDALGLSPDYAYWWYNNGSATGTPQSGNPGYWQTEDRSVQLGHGGYASTIVIASQQDITVTAGTGDLNNADGNASTGGITFIGGDMERDFAQLGHGGHSSGANNALGLMGDIKVTAHGGGLVFDGSILGAQAMRRTTGVSRNGVDAGQVVYNGNTTGAVVRGNGGGWEAYVQLGHGGYGARGIHSGDITIDAWGGVQFLGAPAAPVVDRLVTNAPLTQGLNAGTGVWISLANFVNTQVVNTPAENQYQQVEHISNIVPGTIRIELSDGRVITDVPRVSSDDQTSAPTTGSPAVFVPQPTAGLFLDGVKVGEVHYNNGTVSFRAGGITAAANTGTGIDPVAAPVDLGGATVTQATFQTAQGQKERAYVQLGHGGYESDGPNIASGTYVTQDSNFGNINIRAGGDIVFQGGAAHRTSAQLGHGGYGVYGSNYGNISIDHIDASNARGRVGGVIFLAGHGGHRQFDYHNYAMLGHGGIEARGGYVYGNIFVRGTETASGLGLVLKAGDRQDAFVQIGHGGFNSRSGTGDGALNFGMNGDIDIEVSGDVALVAGTLSKTNPLYMDDGRLYTMIGHGGYDSDPSGGTNNANFTSFGDTSAARGTREAGLGNWGHFGDISVVTTGGSVSVMGGSNIPVGDRLDFDGQALGIADRSLDGDPLDLLTSRGDGGGIIHWAQIGHGGYATGGSHYGNITVSAEGSVHVVGGMDTVDDSTQKRNYAQIGHGASNAPGNMGKEGDFIKVHALGANSNVAVVAGDGSFSTGQIGHGGTNTGSQLGDHASDISVIAGNNLLLNSGNANLPTNWGKIGHADVRNLASGTLQGDIHVSVGNTLRMGRAVLGHVDYKLYPGFFSGFVEGDTFVAVGRRNPDAGGPGEFITTADSVISSIGGGTAGELRLYMPDASSNRIAVGTNLNGSAYVRTPAPGSNRPDEQYATEHRYPAGTITEADAVFTPEGDYPFHGFGLYNIYYGGEAPPVPPTPPVTPEVPLPPGPPTTPVNPPSFGFGPYVFGDTYDAFFRYEDLFLYDGYDELLGSLAYRDALEDGSPVRVGSTLIEEMLDGTFGPRSHSEIAPGSTVLDEEDDEELLRRKRRASRQVGKGALTYYVYDPGTNRYSSYRVFGVEQTRLSVTQ